MRAFVEALAAVTPSPSPSVNDFQRAVEEWPEPPRWLFIVLMVMAALLALVVLATAATAIGSWSSRTKRDVPPRTTEWVDLSTIETRKSGIDRHTAVADDASADDGGAETEPTRDDDKPEA